MPSRDRDKWNDRYRQTDGEAKSPSPFLTSMAPMLPRSGRALDIAGGAGQNALWLAKRGLEVTLADISEEALNLAGHEALRRDLSLLQVEIDLEESPLPAGPWDLITGFCYLQRSLFPAMCDEIAEGGLLLYCQPTKTNLLRWPSPSAAYLLDEGELRQLASPLEILHYEEGWTDELRHEARLVGRKCGDRTVA